MNQTENSIMTDDTSPNYYMLGASYGGNDDQTERFVQEGIWVNGWPDRNLDLVNAIKPGDRVAIKAAFVRKNDLPFDTDGKEVSTMRIKATGVVSENQGDGRHLKVTWKLLDPPREWYMHTYQGTVWKLNMADWRAQALVDFVFNDAEQDFERFKEHPPYRANFKRSDSPGADFEWTDFNEELAGRLLEFKDNRAPLIKVLKTIAEREQMGIFIDRFADGSSRFLEDICPFTFMALYNREMTDTNRTRIAGMVAEGLELTLSVPTTFPGVPTVNNRSSWFFDYAKKRQPEDIDILWELFDAAWQLCTGVAHRSDPERAFIDAWNRALKVRQVKWNISSGLYRAMPWHYVTLDSQSRQYLSEQFGVDATSGRRDQPPTGEQYLKLIDDLQRYFDDDDSPVHSFPELSLAAYTYSGTTTDDDDSDEDEIDDYPESDGSLYTSASILEDGCFLPLDEIDAILKRLQSKKNLILQGPPGTGKTWLAKRLGYAICGENECERVRSVQFHPTLSYEDFVRGWRPSGRDGELALVDGIFMEVISAALAEKDKAHVLVIEEINRGNPAQIFGELLTLIEAARRNPSDALELAYRRGDDADAVHVPPNLFIIGTMNLADRSLAIVDFALRRRFAFTSLKPMLNPAWHEWVTTHCSMDPAIASRIERAMTALNSKIEKDTRLGAQYCVGHSYVTPHEPIPDGETIDWFRAVVTSEIHPLLEEYYFDAAAQAQELADDLLRAVQS